VASSPPPPPPPRRATSGCLRRAWTRKKSDRRPSRARRAHRARSLQKTHRRTHVRIHRKAGAGDDDQRARAPRKHRERRCHQGKGNSTIDNYTTKASPTKRGGKQSSCTISGSMSEGIRGCTATHRQPKCVSGGSAAAGRGGGRVGRRGGRKRKGVHRGTRHLSAAELTPNTAETTPRLPLGDT